MKKSAFTVGLIICFLISFGCQARGLARWGRHWHLPGSVHDYLNKIQNQLKAVREKYIEVNEITKLNTEYQRIKQMFSYINQFKSLRSTSSWSHIKVSKENTNRGTATAEYESYQAQVRKEYGAPWTTQQYSNKLGNTTQVANIARMDRTVDHTDTKLREMINDLMPKVDTLVEEIKNSYNPEKLNCRSGKTCTKADFMQAQMMIAKAKVDYQKKLTRLNLLIAEIENLQQYAVLLRAKSNKNKTEENKTENTN